MRGFLLRFAGPMQSWGEHSAFGVRDTTPFPTRSGMIGMFAAAQGLARGADLSLYESLRFTVRVDRPGTRMVDFHTAGGGVPARGTIPTAEGKRKGVEVSTVVTERGYLADAVFTIAVEAPDDLGESITAALRKPHWQPYLGRRSHVPDPLLLLRPDVADPVAELRTRAPLPPARQKPETVPVDFVHEGETGSGAEQDGRRTRHILNDIPQTFDAQRRSYATRAVTVLPEGLPGVLAHWRDHDQFLDGLYQYAAEAT
ncbi:type I-E CRISPR-associated protein Cas5/CasD [Nocardiopsis salina]|uniref:type I-E CRISPR-associated protein Cas5/CasD n=1 Tax=Nocardiopsis salina TaxID=245836 RepID=UPI0003782E7C|nr:type I-E CRISPR-associated protein Cas5/CasD [Nocardiopsis salina]